MPYMATTTTLDKAGRIVIPKSVRDELNLGPGDSVELETGADCVTLRPVRSLSRLRKEKGVWVFHSGERMKATEARALIREMREKRDRHNEGQFG